MAHHLNIKDLLAKNPVVPAIRDRSKLHRALAAQPSVIIVFSTSIQDIAITAEQANKAGAILIVHADMMEGISSDTAGLQFLAENGVAGIATTRTQTMTQARHAGLIVTFRAFLIDSAALVTVARIVEQNHPDIVEALPAPILSHLPPAYVKLLNVPILAGGLINTKEDIAAALASGATAVSTSNESLWSRTK